MIPCPALAPVILAEAPSTIRQLAFGSPSDYIASEADLRMVANRFPALQSLRVRLVRQSVNIKAIYLN
jgi:hypothetical protein